MDPTSIGCATQGALGTGSNHPPMAAAALSRQARASATNSSEPAYRSPGSSRRRVYISVTSFVSSSGPATARYSSSSIPTRSRPNWWMASGSISRVVWLLTISRYTASPPVRWQSPGRSSGRPAGRVISASASRKRTRPGRKPVSMAFTTSDRHRSVSSSPSSAGGGWSAIGSSAGGRARI